MAHKRGTHGSSEAIIFSVNSPKINAPQAYGAAERILKKRQERKKRGPLSSFHLPIRQPVCASVTAESQLNASKFTLEVFRASQATQTLSFFAL